MSSRRSLSRRSFLQLGAAGLLGGLTPLGSSRHVLAGARGFGSLREAFQDLLPDQQGRVTPDKTTIYSSPSLQSKPLKIYWRDTVFPITDVTVGDEQPDYNRVWYRAGEDGYVHSGDIQPVKTRPVAENRRLLAGVIPPEGTWAEVTVPFTDAFWELNWLKPFAYRFYYESVHWVLGVEYDAAGEAWMRLLEDKWKGVYYVPAAHLRLIPPEELNPLSPDMPLEAKRIEVLLQQQAVIAYENDTPVFMARAATGSQMSGSDYSTPAGQYVTFCKRAGRHMASGDPAASGFDLPGVPWICYITESGLAIHGAYWHNGFGRPRTHGCINLTPQAARWFYRWTQPIVPAETQQVYENYGTHVDVIV